MRPLARSFVIALPLLLVMALAACSSGSSESTSKASGSVTPFVGKETPGPTPATDCSKLPKPTPPVPTPPEPKVKKYDAKPAMTIDPKKKYLAHLYTETGHIIIDLRPDLAPETVNSFVFLANDSYFDGLTFHRVIKDFVAQTGDPTGTGSGGPGYSLPLESSEVPFERGIVGMARTNNPDSGGSQWFITLGTASHLNKQYTVFGNVVQGQDVADCITQGERIVKVTITEL